MEVTPVRLPVTEPLIEATSRSGAEIREIFLAAPVPAVMFMVMNPTGSVVAFCADEDAMVPARTIAAMERMEVEGFMVWKVEYLD